MATVPEHRSFMLTRARGAESSPSSGPLRLIWPNQFGLAVIWFLLWGMILCMEAEQVALWLPLNYLLLDLYLFARDSVKGHSWARTSKLTALALRTSPIWMLVTTLILGMVGSGLNVRMLQ